MRTFGQSLRLKLKITVGGLALGLAAIPLLSGCNSNYFSQLPPGSADSSVNPSFPVTTAAPNPSPGGTGGGTSGTGAAPTPSGPPTPFNPSGSSSFSCQSYVTIQPTQATGSSYPVLDIPARDSSGTCYLYKLINAVSFDPSSSNPNVDPNVISRNHDISVSNSYDVHHPYLLGQAQVILYMEGPRSIELAGATSDTAPITVDNFLLVGIYPSTQAGDPSFYRAYGTADSTVYNTNDILFLNQDVPLTPFATGGTSTIAPLSLTAQMTTQENYTLDVRALDCGAVGNTSNIYLLIQ